MVTPLGSCLVYNFTPSEGLKGFDFYFLEKLDLASATMKCDHGKRPFDMEQLQSFRVHNINNP